MAVATNTFSWRSGKETMVAACKKPLEASGGLDATLAFGFLASTVANAWVRDDEAQAF